MRLGIRIAITASLAVVATFWPPAAVAVVLTFLAVYQTAGEDVVVPQV